MARFRDGTTSLNIGAEGRGDGRDHELLAAPTICSSCPVNTKCCRHADPPDLVAHDLRLISRSPAARNIAFHEDLPEELRPLRKMARRSSGECIFLTDDRQCAIYDIRPLDCRLFPLDLTELNGEIWWVIYHSFCPLGSE